MATTMKLDEWLDVNILWKSRAPSIFEHDTDPPVGAPQPKPQKKLTRTIRREDRELAARRAKLERERRKQWKPSYPSDS